ncbi:CAP domain-containing protein [Butyrivibrio sp. MC2021]|uniref:CAP domain-containing protein n=1 Tax=Butyrivibrio sp. MC2021 TaxID=1408306 RepID=UPI0006853EF8|nr:CAP domain-containing protein [Butyrivibrio sp. MC2021]
MKKLKRISSVALAAVIGLSLMACGAASEESVADVAAVEEATHDFQAIDDQAAIRGLDEGVGEYYIDDEAIALAGEAVQTQAAQDACEAVYNLMNQRRAAQGLPALAKSDKLTAAAQVRASEITTHFSHTRPHGEAFWTVDSSVQYGENLAKLYQSADSVFTAWMNSPTHAANIMDAGYKTVGIAICQTADGSWYWAQEFGY